jgi:hypothetical protein
MSKEEKSQDQMAMVTPNKHSSSEPREILLSPTAIFPETNAAQPAKQAGRASWSNRIVYLLSIIGFVVDLGKVLRSV